MSKKRKVKQPMNNGRVDEVSLAEKTMHIGMIIVHYMRGAYVILVYGKILPNFFIKIFVMDVNFPTHFGTHDQEIIKGYTHSLALECFLYVCDCTTNNVQDCHTLLAEIMKK